MSLNELILNQPKKYLNIRVNDLKSDGTFNAKSINSSGLSTFETIEITAASPIIGLDMQNGLISSKEISSQIASFQTTTSDTLIVSFIDPLGQAFALSVPGVISNGTLKSINVNTDNLLVSPGGSSRVENLAIGGPLTIDQYVSLTELGTFASGSIASGLFLNLSHDVNVQFNRIGRRVTMSIEAWNIPSGNLNPSGILSLTFGIGANSYLPLKDTVFSVVTTNTDNVIKSSIMVYDANIKSFEINHGPIDSNLFTETPGNGLVQLYDIVVSWILQ